MIVTSPTPRVSWSRLGLLLSDTDNVQRTSFGQEITFTDIDSSHEGTYRCSATNSDSNSPVYHDISLRVECKSVSLRSWGYITNCR